MSHTAEIKTVMKNAAALLAACKELGLPAPVKETVRFFDGKKEHLTNLRQHYTLAVTRQVYGRTHRIAHVRQEDGKLRIVVSQ